MFHPKGLKPHLEGRSRSPLESGVGSGSGALGRALCLTPRGSPLPGRVSHLSDRFQDSLSLNADTDALLAKISAMFPTVSETHIKILLKKYYNREAVVISALQVEKHPITTPGPVAMSPGGARHHARVSLHGSAHFTATTATSTPQGSPSLFRPASGASSYGAGRSADGQPRHQSPKMKLKYLKSIFPKAEETLILDVLANKDNNVQLASEELLSMGFPRKEPVVPPQRRDKEALPVAPTVNKILNVIKTAEEKAQLKQQLQQKYPGVAERVVVLALESAAYRRDRADQILAAALQESLPTATATATGTTTTATARPTSTATTQHENVLKMSGVGGGVGSGGGYRSAYGGAAGGPDPALHQGPNDSLLLLDYLPWNGPNPEYCGSAAKTHGASPGPSGVARGPAALARGPAGLAAGSIYRRINKKTANLEVFSN
ncbi:unnamed protein product [Chilo suppressalis]|uniref:CUE domain-containing protein n=1 Tax=Chilo suppressalis TaxID=168631 RepID=A0ABN8L6N6_CHISP|nr:unnamed protein product [Chilo suppressalis]